MGSTIGGIPHVIANALDTEHGYQVAVMFCQNCGFVRLHAMEPYES